MGSSPNTLPCVSQVASLEAQLAAACSRAETAERQQQAAAAAATLALSRAQQELQEARSAQFVAEEAHRTAEAAAKLLAQKVAGKRERLCGGQLTSRADPGSLFVVCAHAQGCLGP